MESMNSGAGAQKPVVIQQKSSGIPVAIVALAVIALLGIVLMLGGIFLLALVSSPKGFPDRDLKTHFVTGDTKASDRAALIPVVGIIQDVEGGGLLWGGLNQVEAVRKRLKKAAKDKVKAVILEVDSPGGAVTASDTLYREVVKFKKDNPGIPVVVHMKDLAASGGYYISAPADWIVASPTTLTGSIGVILLHKNLNGLTEGKLGIKIRAYTSAAQKDILSPFRDMTEAEQRHLQSIVDELYDQFVGIVVKCRKDKISEDKVRALEGTILTGKQALARGLVDQLGTLDDVVAKAVDLAKVKSLRVVRYNRAPSVLEQILSARIDARVQVGPSFDLDTYLSRGGSPFLYLWRP